MHKLILVPLISIFFVSNLIAQSSTFSDYVPTIPASRRVDWHNVGDKQIPSSYDKVYDVRSYGAIPNDGNDDRQAIQDAIETARVYNSSHPGSFCSVYLPQGIYNINSGSINLINDASNDYSNICLKGDESDKTKLYYPNNNKEIAIYIKGNSSSDQSTI